MKTLVIIAAIGLAGILPLLAQSEVVTWKYQGSGENGRCNLVVKFDTSAPGMSFEPSFYAPAFQGSFPDSAGTVNLWALENQHELEVRFAETKPGYLAPVWMEHRWHMGKGVYQLDPEHCANMKEVK